MHMWLKDHFLRFGASLHYRMIFLRQCKTQRAVYSQKDATKEPLNLCVGAQEVDV